MNPRDFDAMMREHEHWHQDTVDNRSWYVLRVDGHGFSKLLNQQYFTKPYDGRVYNWMVNATNAVRSTLLGLYAYTESDELSVLVAPGNDQFGRKQEKLVSLSAGIASASFTRDYFSEFGWSKADLPHFDSRVCVLSNVDDVVDYFSWRQSDAVRCGLNGYAYWALRDIGGMTAAQATSRLWGLTSQDKVAMLKRDFNIDYYWDVPLRDQNGTGLYGTMINPYEITTLTRDRYREFVRGLCEDYLGRKNNEA